MKLSKIRFVRANDYYLANTIELPFEGALPSDPYIVKDLTGLGPPDMVVSQTSALEQDSDISNVVFHNRQLVATLELNPDYTANVSFDDLRTKFYNMVGARGMKGITVEFMTEGDTTYNYKTMAGISKIVPNLFTKGGQELQITIDCLSPFIYGQQIDVGKPGELASTIYEVNNPGTAYCGFEIELYMGEATAGIVIAPDWAIFDVDNAGDEPWMSISYPFLAGDVITINTIPGSRGAKLTRSGIDMNLLPYVQGFGYSKWVMLAPGYNVLQLNFLSNFQVQSFKLTPRYLGV